MDEYLVSKLRKIENCKGKIKEIMTDSQIISLAIDGAIPHYIIFRFSYFALVHSILDKYMSACLILVKLFK